MKYFVVKEDLCIGEYEKAGKKESVIINAGQPFEILRDVSEYGYVILVTGKAIAIKSGSFSDSITLKEEVEMWKIISKYNEYMYYYHFDLVRSTFNDQTKFIENMWLEMNEKNEIIKAYETIYKKNH
jgi:hypothetical protein